MKTYTYEPTKNPDIFRVVDREGNWKRYWIKSKNVFLDGITTVLERGYAKGMFFEEWLLRITPQERDAILKSTGERGDKVHRAVDTVLTYKPDPTEARFEGMNEEEFNEARKTSVINRETGIWNRATKDYEKLENDEWDCLLAWSRFWEAHAPVLVVSEHPTYSIEHGYAGTLDVIIVTTKACDVKKCRAVCEKLVGKFGVWDWKTSSGIRPSYSAQVETHANAENIGEYLPPNAKIDYTAICRVGTNHKTTGGYEIAAWTTEEERKDAFGRFLAAKKIFDFESTPFDPEKDIEDVPDEIKISVNAMDQEKLAEAKAAAGTVEAAETEALKCASDEADARAALETETDPEKFHELSEAIKAAEKRRTQAHDAVM